MKIYVAGGSGQVGFEVCQRLNTIGTIFSPTREELDLKDLQGVTDYLNELKPDIIVNAAAWTAVDDAESDIISAYSLNHALPSVFANYAVKQSIWLLHYSSDYVYSGQGNAPWKEDAETAPLSVYGKSKLAGDQAIQASGAQHLILRTSWVYSCRCKNFMKTILKLALEKENLSVVSDQWGAPTPASLIAELSALLIARLKNGQRLDTGIYHLSAAGETNWHEFATEIVRLAQAKGVNVKVRDIASIESGLYKTPATRPLNSRLNTTKLQEALSIELPHWKDQLEITLFDYIAALEKRYKYEP